jgi:hypothetical protein
MIRDEMAEAQLRQFVRGAQPTALDQRQVAKAGLRPHIGFSGVILSAKERHHQMTMFSMKPKFNLAEFLAVPAPVGGARSRNARRRKMAFQPGPKSDGAALPTHAKDTERTDKPKV